MTLSESGTDYEIKKDQFEFAPQEQEKGLRKGAKTAENYFSVPERRDSVPQGYPRSHVPGMFNCNFRFVLRIGPFLKAEFDLLGLKSDWIQVIVLVKSEILSV